MEEVKKMEEEVKKTAVIRVLPPEEARKIAAGEVIDRPSALVREFLDNAIDAGGSLIEVLIEDGGIRRAEVVDNGGGMGKEDLELCWLTHATSKIRSMDDLKTAATLGFRGEALAAAAAVSRLEILSSRDGREAWKLSVGPGERNAAAVEQSRRARGTSVRALGLYDTIPARKRFLKRPGSEAAACRQVFNEKALAFPGAAFRFTQDGVLKAFLPPAPSLRERFARLFLEERESAFLHEISANGGGFSVTVVAGGPELSRGDRRFQFVFANNRRVQDFALLQALEYGLQGWFPNGTHPLGAVFVTIDPALADFNIHPAKREARFADPGAIHHTVSSCLRDFCRKGDIAFPGNDAVYGGEFAFGKAGQGRYTGGASSGNTSKGSDTSFGNAADSAASGRLAMEALLSKLPEFAPLPGRAGPPPSGGESFPGYGAASTGFQPDFHAAAGEQPASYPKAGARYVGRLFGLFIIVEKGDGLFIIDQHAAHERVLYDRFMRGPIARQELLVAIPFETESPEDDRFLEEKRGELERLGVTLRREDTGRGHAEWLIEALPSGWKLPDGETVTEILGLKAAGGNMAERWMAALSCHAAVRDGDFLDEAAALSLAEEAFALPVRRCPHGRPIWFEISRLELLKAVKRA
jgi:DNA mismatch repair protein MutL